ncbi:MAG: thioredoxin domain-containing protein [Hyphomicrobiales bacterium]|nr:thioredoxin domain-containing protein [Hyphomicrobiales bacterium]
MIDRRLLLAGLVVSAGVGARADEIPGDDGKPAPTWRLPSEISLDLPGTIVAGSPRPDAILVEFFDYNCPWCRKSAPDLERMVSKDRNFSLHLIQNAVLSLGSVQAAKVALAVRAATDDATAWRFHRALIARRGQVSGQEALAEARNLKLDAAAIEAKADSDEITLQVRKHSGVSRALGMEATPSFAIDGMGIGGWPGVRTIQRIVGNVRACDAISC